jgi:aldehyde:ferredoxin oxidoreductase
MHYKLLEINLSTKENRIVRLPKEIIKDYIGGRGLGAKLLLEVLAPGVDPLSPENVMFWLTGPLTGSLVPGLTKHVVITKSPTSGGYVDSYSSGGIGYNLVYAGYNGLMVKGRSDEPVYIYINDDKIEIRSAVHVWGKGAYKAAQILTNEIKEEGFGHAVIGQAGENKVYFACINNDFYRQAARGGIGAVMGSKNLKAIFVKGSGGVECNDINGFLDFHEKKLKEARKNPSAEGHKRAGTSVTFDLTNEAGMLPTHNFRTGYFKKGEGKLDSTGYVLKSKGSLACLGCPVPCGKVLQCETSTRGKFRLEGPEYETASLLGSNLENSSLDLVAEANMICDDLGMDTISAGNILGFIMEANERGLLKSIEYKQIEDVRFDNPEGAMHFLYDIALRKGIGDWAANGVRFLAEKIGNHSIDFAMQTKSLEFPGYDPRRAFGAGLAYAVAPRGACHRRAWPPAMEVCGDVPPYTFKGKGKMIKEEFDERNITHSLVACDFCTFAVPISMQEYMRYLELVTGYKYTELELEEIAQRIETTIRYFNKREGLSRKDDTLPKRVLFEPMPDGPAKGRFITQEGLDKMLDEYYEVRGWDKNGIPTEATLSKYGIKKEGIL